MKNAINNYYQKLEKTYLEEFNSKPTVTYTEKLNKSLLISKPNEDGEVEWRPKFIDEKIDFRALEKEFGFKISDELKEYYSTYYFLRLRGEIGKIDLRFYPLNKNIEETIKQHLKDGRYYFEDEQIFLLGDANVNGIDGYFVFYDNKTEELFCYDCDEFDFKESKFNTKKAIILKSIVDTINSMENCF